MSGYDAGLIIEKFNEHPLQMIPLAALAMGFGFIQYVYCFLMSRRGGISPFPIWMHAFYLAHDFLFITLFRLWFGRYHSFVFQAIWAGMIMFNLLELYAINVAIRHERQEAFGRYYDRAVTVRQATIHVGVITVVSFVILSTARSFLNDTLMFCIFVSTNVVMAIAPALTMMTRRKRVRGSLGLAVFIVLGTIATFLPKGLGMYTTADPDYFSRPWFFILGTICLSVSLWHLVTITRLPRPS